MYCKEKWRTAGGKDPLFGHVDGFQIGPNKTVKNRFIRLLFQQPAAQPQKT
ncbi:MAG: hypothetical protein ACLR40_04625 [Oscillospiraceae bacterium]